MPRKLPFMPWATGDWLKDPALSFVSAAARGVWADMLCVMWESEVRGVLQCQGKAWSRDETAAILRGDMSVNRDAIDELFAAGVASERGGAIISRRMVRDEEVRRATRNRVRKHRSGIAGDVTPDVTEGERVRNAPSSVSVSQNQPTNQSERAPPPDGGGLVGGGLADKDSQDPVIEALTRAGVVPRNRLTLAALPGLTAPIIDRVDRKVRQGGGDTGAVVVAIKAESGRIVAKGRVAEKRKANDRSEHERLKTLYAQAEAEERARRAEVDHE